MLGAFYLYRGGLQQGRALQNQGKIVHIVVGTGYPIDGNASSLGWGYFWVDFRSGSTGLAEVSDFAPGLGCDCECPAKTADQGTISLKMATNALFSERIVSIWV